MIVNYRKKRKIKKVLDFIESWYAWLSFLLMIALILTISGALYFQYVKGMEPCYLCIIQRIGVLIAIMGAIIGIIGSTIFKQLYIKCIGMVVVLGGILLSLYSAIKLVHMQINPPLISNCGMSANELMESYGFLKSLPILFKGSASCSGSAGSFILSFEQWALLLFVVYLVVLAPLFIFYIYQNMIKK